MWAWAFWRDALERAIRAAAAAALATIGTDGLGLLRVGWLAALTTAALAGLASLLLSLVGGRFAGDPGTPSLLPSVPQPTAPQPRGRHASD